MKKKELRKEILEKRANIPKEERIEKSKQIAEKILCSSEFAEAKKVLMYAPYKSEVDIFHVFEKAKEQGKEVYFPKVKDHEMEFYRVYEKEKLQEGFRGIFEPIPSETEKFLPVPEEQVLVLMPGAVFDEVGGRIGYGGGYYDKFLQKLEQLVPSQNLFKIAVAFQCQIVEAGMILREEHDVKPDYVYTEVEQIQIRHKYTGE